MKDYQNEFSKLNPHLEKHFYESEAVHRLMAGKTTKICEEYLGGVLSNLICLEIGSSTGYVTRYLSTNFKHTIGLDIDKPGLEFAAKNNRSCDCAFILADAMNIPLEDESVDVVVCNAIYEHVPDAEILMKEIYRVLKKDGFCYFGAGNRLPMFWEAHYQLPFIAWLPRGLAGWILRLTKKADFYYETHFTYWGLVKLVSDFQIHDFTIKVIKNPRGYYLDQKIRGTLVYSKIPGFIYRIIYPLFPAYIWILTRKQQS